jgi:hypothetical protein
MDALANITFFAGTTFDFKHLSGYTPCTHSVPKTRGPASIGLLGGLGLEELESHAGDIYNQLLEHEPSDSIFLDFQGVKVTQLFGPNQCCQWEHSWAFDANQMRQVWLNQQFRLTEHYASLLQNHLPAIHSSTLNLTHTVDLQAWADRVKGHFQPKQLRFHILSHRITLQYSEELYWEITPGSLTLHSNTTPDQRANGGGCSYSSMIDAWNHIGPFLSNHV